jgi:hypothetical protein
LGAVQGTTKIVQGIPNYLAIASILGVPRAVDINFTKVFGRSRMKVVVLDSSLIPTFVDAVIEDFVYQLRFRVESGMPNGEPILLDLGLYHGGRGP